MPGGVSAAAGATPIIVITRTLSTNAHSRVTNRMPDPCLVTVGREPPNVPTGPRHRNGRATRGECARTSVPRPVSTGEVTREV